MLLLLNFTVGYMGVHMGTKRVYIFVGLGGAQYAYRFVGDTILTIFARRF